MSYTVNPPFTVAIVSDCYGQAMSRMSLRVMALLPNATCVPFESTCPVEAGGNIVDALDAFLTEKGECRGMAVLCNSAPRKDARNTNGSHIVTGTVRGVRIIATACSLGLVKKLIPNLMVRTLDVDKFTSLCVQTDRHTFNFRGLEVLPRVLERALHDHDEAFWSSITLPFDDFPHVEPCVWHVDTIGGHPTNLKLTTLRDECKKFAPCKKARVHFPKSGSTSDVVRDIDCFERLAEIPTGSLGLYEGSSGLGTRRFLEIAVMGGRAAQDMDVRAGDPIAVTIS